MTSKCGQGVFILKYIIISIIISIISIIAAIDLLRQNLNKFTFRIKLLLNSNWVSGIWAKYTPL